MLEYYIECVSLCQLTVEGQKSSYQGLPFHIPVTGSFFHAEQVCSLWRLLASMLSRVQQADCDTEHTGSQSGCVI